MKKLILIGTAILALASCKKDEIDYVYDCRHIKAEIESKTIQLMYLVDMYNVDTNMVTNDMLNEAKTELQLTEDLYEECLNGNLH